MSSLLPPAAGAVHSVFPPLPPMVTIGGTASVGLTAFSAERKTRLLADIARLKTEKNALILAHLYERLEVQEVADYQGDSLGLSQQAASTGAETILFCGVHFMAETAKLLSPEKTVILANPNAGCPMADMISPEQLAAFKAQHPGAPVVAYVNTSAAVKALSDICCTSANAVDVVRHVVETTGKTEILFVPDKHLGAFVQEQLDAETAEGLLPPVKLVCYDGFCPTHLRVELDDLLALKKAHPEALVLVHPECDEPVKALADVIGSTTALVQAAHKCDGHTYIVCTEDGVAQRLAQDLPHKRFFTPSKAQALCPNMKMTRLEHLVQALEGHVAPIEIEPAVAEAARASIERMLAVPVTSSGPFLAGSAACRCKDLKKNDSKPAKAKP